MVVPCKLFFSIAIYNMHIWMDVWLIQILVTPLSVPLLSAPRVHASHQLHFGAVIIDLKMKWWIDKWANTKALLTKSRWQLNSSYFNPSVVIYSLVNYCSLPQWLLWQNRRVHPPIQCALRCSPTYPGTDKTVKSPQWLWFLTFFFF